MELNLRNLKWVGSYCLLMVAVLLSAAVLAGLPFYPWTWKLWVVLPGGPAAIVALMERSDWPDGFGYLALMAGVLGLAGLANSLELRGPWRSYGYYAGLYGAYMLAAWWLFRVGDRGS